MANQFIPSLLLKEFQCHVLRNARGVANISTVLC
jgi:hypothetical protein